MISSVEVFILSFKDLSKVLNVTFKQTLQNNEFALPVSFNLENLNTFFLKLRFSLVLFLLLQKKESQKGEKNIFSDEDDELFNG